jgi:hypothetical protein
LLDQSVFITLDGPLAHDNSGRDDKFVAGKWWSTPSKNSREWLNKFVISTGPGFPATQHWTLPRVLLSLRKAA